MQILALVWGAEMRPVFFALKYPQGEVFCGFLIHEKGRGRRAKMFGVIQRKVIYEKDSTGGNCLK